MSVTILENQDHDQYLVKVDGSGRVAHRNRRFLISFKTAMQTLLLSGTRLDTCLTSPQVSSPPTASTHGAWRDQIDFQKHDDHCDVQ